jgi:hypothetical protein
LQEQVNEKTVALSVKTAKLTGRMLAQAMRAFLTKARASPKTKPGRVSMKSLTREGASLSHIEIDDPGVKQFDRIARKYNVRYYPQIDRSENPPRHIIFFRAKDADSLTAAFTEYSKQQLLHKERRPSLLERLERAKALVSRIAAPVKNRNKGGHEL